MDRLEKLYKKYGKKKLYIALGISISILHIIILFIVYQTNISFSIDGKKFKYISTKGDIVLFKDKEGNLVTINREDNSTPGPLIHIANKYTIEYEDKMIMVDCTKWFEDDIIIILSNGEEYKQDWGSVVSTEFMGNPNSGEPLEVEFVNNINLAYDFTRDNPLPFIPLLTIPLIFLGLVGIMYPKELWKFQHYFTVEEGNPTEWAISCNRIGGVLTLCFVLLSPFLIF